MWFTSVYSKTVRDYRVAIAGWGVGVGLLMYSVLAAVSVLLSTAAARASLVSLAMSFSWVAEPVRVDTPGGYATWKYGFTILVMALWPILVGSRMLRGEEERGSLDVLLSLPRPRLRVALEKLAAIWTALLAMGLLIGLLTVAGGRRASADISLGDALLFGLNLALIGGVFGSAALLIAQFTQERRTAAGAASGLLLLCILVDMVHRVNPRLEWVSRFSPVYYYNLSKPLVPGYGANLVALLCLLAISVVMSGAALWLFVRRDVGGTAALPRFLRLPRRAERPAQALPVGAWSLRSLYRRNLATMLVPTAWWTLAIAGFAAWMVVIIDQTEQKLAALTNSSALFRTMLTKVGGGAANSTASLLSFVFLILPVLLMAYAVTQASRWAADEEDGLHELVLATPQPRLTVLLARFGALTTTTVAIGVLTLVCTALAAHSSGLVLDGGNLTAASLSMIPLGLLVAALGYLFAGWLRAAVDTGLLSFLLALWFFISFIGPELNWPGMALRFSAFYYYGTPLVHGLAVGNMVVILAVSLAALALASARFVRKDIGV